MSCDMRPRVGDAAGASPKVRGSIQECRTEVLLRSFVAVLNERFCPFQVLGFGQCDLKITGAVVANARNVLRRPSEPKPAPV